MMMKTSTKFSRQSAQVQIVDNLERVINNEPFNGVVEVCCKHSFTVIDLLALGVVVVLHLKFAHIDSFHFRSFH